eukprot:TRINITY_DN2365_c0_g1_i6.p1 TRINITY_DN2365_c0_g1~~TRINITY_DN2365_c0_g1_i6.p1  ORF type:complete len:212 (+),score=3.79 TRINITY_DN2365_c0_g1_i6:68-703(+)
MCIRDRYYTNPLMRLNATVLGVWTSIQVFKLRNGDQPFLVYSLEKKLGVRRIGYLASMALLFHIFVLPTKALIDMDHWSNQVKFLYILISRYAFLGLSLFLTIPCLIDQTVFLSRFFGNKFVLPFARVCTMIYMIGVIVITMGAYSIRQSIYFSLQNVAMLFLYSFVSTLMTSCEVHFLVEGSLLNVMETYFNINWKKKEIDSNLPLVANK